MVVWALYSRGSKGLQRAEAKSGAEYRLKLLIAVGRPHQVRRVTSDRPGWRHLPAYLTVCQQQSLLADVRVVIGGRPAVCAGHAAHGQAVLRAHDQLRLAGLGLRQSGRVSLPGHTSADGPAVAADAGHAAPPVGRRRRLPRRRRGLPGQLLREGSQDGLPPGRGRGGQGGAGAFRFARR